MNTNIYGDFQICISVPLSNEKYIKLIFLIGYRYVEKDAWFSFVVVKKDFLGNNKAANCVKLVDSLLKVFQNLKSNMSIKVHFLFSHLNKIVKMLAM